MPRPSDCLAIPAAILIVLVLCWEYSAYSSLAASRLTIESLRAQLAVCAESQTAALADSSELLRLHRQLYLRDVRSYRLADTICDDDSDKKIPAVATEPAFRCLPRGGYLLDVYTLSLLSSAL